MSRPRPVLTKFLIAATLCMAMSGCLRKAALGVWQASESTLPGAGRVALVGVAGDHDGQLETVLTKRLSTRAAWALVDTADVMPAVQLASADDATATIESLIEHASASDVELLLSAEVEEATVTPPAAWQVLSDDGVASVTIRFAAYQTSGDDSARVSRVITRTMPVPASTRELSDATFSQLAYEVVDVFLSEFEPRNASIELMLAANPVNVGGRRTVRAGNAAARRGRWSVAAEYYQRALKANPDNDAAVFNLALVAVTERRFDEAEQLALQAIRMRHEPVYIDGLEAIQDLADEDTKVRYQLGETSL